MAVPVVIMLPWLAANPAVSAGVVTALALARGPRALLRTLDRAGRAVLAH